MREQKTEAIILDATDVFDADRSLLLFSRQFGKIRARARGVRKSTSRLTGHLLSYIPTQLEVVETGGWFMITQAQILSHYASSQTYPANALLFLRQAAIVAEAVNRLFVDRDAHPGIYDGLVYTLDRLRDLCGEEGTEAPVKNQLVVAEFLFKCLAELGYLPELYRCVLTGQPLDPEFIAWNSQLGGTLSKKGFDQSGTGIVLSSPKTIVAVRQLLRPEFMAERLGMPDEIQQEVSRVVYDYLQTQIGQPLRSLGGA